MSCSAGNLSKTPCRCTSTVRWGGRVLFTQRSGRYHLFSRVGRFVGFPTRLLHMIREYTCRQNRDILFSSCLQVSREKMICFA